MYNELSPGEQTAINLARYTKCMDDSTRNYNDFLATSGTDLVDYDRDQAWKYEYKKDDTIVETSSVSVWRVNGTVAYFRYSLSEGGVTKNKFVKITTTINGEMINDLKDQKCAKRNKITITDSASSATAKLVEVAGADDADTNFTVNVTHTFDYTQPAYFGALKLKRTKKTYNNDTDALTKTENFEYILSAISNPAAQNTSYTYYSNREYCTPKPTTTGPNTYNFPFELDCKTDSNIDPAAFNPATELVI
jgi:hypothetical protein